MKKHVLVAVLLILGLDVAEWAAIQAAGGDLKKDEPRPAVAADEDLLKAAGLTGDGQALLDFFRKRTVQRVDPEKIKSGRGTRPSWKPRYRTRDTNTDRGRDDSHRLGVADVAICVLARSVMRASASTSG